MKHRPPTRQLPGRPDLGQLKRQAKELLDAFRSGEAGAVAEVNLFYERAHAATFALHDAQLVLARSYGYASWRKLKAFVDGIDVGRWMEAARAVNAGAMRALLSSRPDLVRATDPANHGYTALHYAVLSRDGEAVRMLMEAGADPRAGIYPYEEATCPSAIAEERGYDELAGILGIEHRPDLRDQLRDAFHSGDQDAVIRVLDRQPGQALYKLPDDGRTLLHVAVRAQMPLVAAWLLDHGADVNAEAKDGSTPLDAGGAKMAALLRERGARMTVRAAVMLGDIKFLETAPDLVTPRDDRGWLLSVAVDNDRPDMLAWLLDRGLDPDARVRLEDEGDTMVWTWGMPLYQCARYRKRAMAEMLLRRGADPNGQVYASGTPLSEAYGQRDDEMVALLERYGGKSNASMAGLYRRADLAQRLIEEFGDQPLPDDGFSSGPVAEQLLGAAARGGDPEILRMAMEHTTIPDGDPRWNGLLQAPLGFWNHWIGPWRHPEWDRTTYLTCFRMILERCGPPNGRLRAGTTILHHIVMMGDHVKSHEQLAFAAAALDAGARMDLRDDLLKSTPLGWACRWGREEIVRFLLECGADPVEAEAEPWARPLAWAGKKGHRAIAAMLEAAARQLP